MILNLVSYQVTTDTAQLLIDSLTDYICLLNNRTTGYGVIVNGVLSNHLVLNARTVPNVF